MQAKQLPCRGFGLILGILPVGEALACRTVLALPASIRSPVCTLLKKKNPPVTTRLSSDSATSSSIRLKPALAGGSMKK